MTLLALLLGMLLIFGGFYLLKQGILWIIIFLLALMGLRSFRGR